MRSQGVEEENVKTFNKLFLKVHLHPKIDESHIIPEQFYYVKMSFFSYIMFMHVPRKPLFIGALSKVLSGKCFRNAENMRSFSNLV